MPMCKAGIWHILYGSKHWELSGKQVFQVLTCLVSTCILIQYVKAGRKSKQVLEKWRHLALSEHNFQMHSLALPDIALLLNDYSEFSSLVTNNYTCLTWRPDSEENRKLKHVKRQEKWRCLSTLFFSPWRCCDASASAVSSLIVLQRYWFTSTQS